MNDNVSNDSNNNGGSDSNHSYKRGGGDQSPNHISNNDSLWSRNDSEISDRLLQSSRNSSANSATILDDIRAQNRLSQAADRKRFSQFVPSGGLVGNLDPNSTKLYSKDLAQVMAEERIQEQTENSKKRFLYQTIIFIYCFVINFFGRFRQQYLYMQADCTQDFQEEEFCTEFMYTVAMCSGVGFIILGNIYDNVDAPRKVTIILMVILSFFSFIEAALSKQYYDTDLKKTEGTDFALAVFQIGGIFDAGLLLACIVIIHNWFNSKRLGIVTALWYSSRYLQVAISNYWAFEVIRKVHSLAIQSIVCGFLYLVLAISSYWVFYHHPSHIGIQIQKESEENLEFKDDQTDAQMLMYKRLSMKQIPPTSVKNQQTNLPNGMNIDIEPQQDQQTQMLDVTIIDAFRLKEIKILLISYIFRATHNEFIQISPYFFHRAQIPHQQLTWLCFGAVVGLILVGIFVDLVYKRRLFMAIFTINCLGLCIDLLLFTYQRYPDIDEKFLEKFGFWLLFGALQSANTMLYLILVPMLIAKNQSNKMSAMSQFGRISYAGTVVGVVFGCSATSRYLISANVALIFDLAFYYSDGPIASDVFVLFLLFMANAVLYGQVRKEAQTVPWLYKYCCCCCFRKKKEVDPNQFVQQRDLSEDMVSERKQSYLQSARSSSQFSQFSNQQQKKQ